MLGFVAIGITGVSLLLNIVGLAIPYWESFQSDHVGLWQYCREADVSGIQVGGCVTIPSVLVDGKLQATRAFVILGMLVLAGALICAILKLTAMKENENLPKIAGASAVAAGVLMIVGAIIFAAAWKTTGYSLHAGFALTIVAAVGSFVAGVLFFVNKGQ